MRLAGDALEDGTQTSADAQNAIRMQYMSRTPIMDVYGLPTFGMPENQTTLPVDGASALEELGFN
jgi:hypothetical protein